MNVATCKNSRKQLEKSWFSIKYNSELPGGQKLFYLRIHTSYYSKKEASCFFETEAVSPLCHLILGEIYYLQSSTAMSSSVNDIAATTALHFVSVSGAGCLINAYARPSIRIVVEGHVTG